MIGSGRAVVVMIECPPAGPFRPLVRNDRVPAQGRDPSVAVVGPERTVDGPMGGAGVCRTLTVIAAP